MPRALDEAELDRLYGLPLDEFTRARNELAARLRKEGSREAADEVKALAKPSVSTWALNQVARRRRTELDALLRAGERLRAAQEAALAGGGSRSLRAATGAEREAVRPLVQAARELLAEGGHGASEATVNRVAQTLRAAAVDEEGRELLRAGRLTRDLELGGFEELAGMPVAPAPPKRPRDDRAKKRERVAEARRHAQEARARARDLERDVRERERELERARAEHERAAAAAAEAERELAAAQAP